MRKKLDHIAISEFEVYAEKNLEHIYFGAGFPPFLRGTTTCTFFTDTHFTEQTIHIATDNEKDFIEQLFFFLSEAKKHVESELEKGQLIDSIAEKLSFTIKSFENEILETASLRASRMVWAKIMKGFNPKNQPSMALKMCFISDKNYTKYKSSTTIDPWGGSYYIENLTFEIASQLIEKLKIS